MSQNKGKKQISMSEKARIEHEEEEKERKELARMIHGDATKSEKKEVSAEEKKSGILLAECI